MNFLSLLFGVESILPECSGGIAMRTSSVRASGEALGCQVFLKLRNA